ncbi:heat shock factor protein HSF24 [Coffea eugenioides]|uniref:heat shock factor protein HSF24 n=1 Tax=Coffea eugenioides TaxID=49369 RepID=UPI000F613EB7|nr:heat shock factor protein HSF24 [Coffea eugenioides]
MSQRTVPAPFLTKTYQLVDDPCSDDVISWNESGTTFVVWKTAEFAKDLLPNYFKHNNFSSFVRQLNTYGFRKIVPDKWEFANDNFKRGRKELLTDIRRRKTTTSTQSTNQAGAGKSITTANPTSPANSGEDLGSSSTSSPDSKSPGSVDTLSAEQFADLSDENEKLKKDNQMLSSELAQTKKQCDDLIAFLTKHVNVAPDQINSIMNQGAAVGEMNFNEINCVVDDHVDNKEADDDDDENGNGGSLKLFGVTLLTEKNKKRGRDDMDVGYAEVRPRKDVKTLDFCAPWMRIASCAGETSKVCN